MIIFIVDDEPLAVESLKLNISKAISSEIEIRTYTNSKQVLEDAIEHIQPGENDSQALSFQDSDLVGVEAAINVAKKGGKPVIIEKMNGLASTAYKLNREHLELLLFELSVPAYLNANISKVDGNTICFNVNGKEKSEVFDVITECVGLKSNSIKLDFDGDILIIGDADHPENVMNAVWQAYRQCRLI